MKKYPLVFLLFFFCTSARSTIFIHNPTDSVWKYHNSSQDSVREYVRFHHVHECDYYSEKGIIMQRWINRRIFRRSVAIEFDDHGKRYAKNIYPRKKGKIIHVEWHGVIRQRRVMIRGNRHYDYPHY